MVGAIGLALLAVFAYVRMTEPDYGGTVVAPGLRAEVEVWRDSLGVPHIWAQSAEDLFFAQGYVHAQDRLWQLGLLRRVAEGRLVEVLGGAGRERAAAPGLGPGGEAGIAGRGAVLRLGRAPAGRLRRAGRPAR